MHRDTNTYIYTDIFMGLRFNPLTFHAKFIIWQIHSIIIKSDTVRDADTQIFHVQHSLIIYSRLVNHDEGISKKV